MSERRNLLSGASPPPPAVRPPRSWLLMAGIVAITMVLVYRSMDDAGHESAGGTHAVIEPAAPRNLLVGG